MRRTVAVVCLVAAGCSSSDASSVAIDALAALDVEVSTPTTEATASTTTSPDRARCEQDGLETVSYAPLEPLGAPGEVPPGSFMAELQQRGRLFVGVDESTPGLAERDAGEIVGFEVDIAREIATQIFGSADGRVVTVPLTPDEKVDLAADGTVDLTISAVTMTCDRWDDVDFSAEYFRAHQKFLARQDSPIATEADLAGRRVCVTGSSSRRILEDHTRAQPEERPARTDCLVALQEGEVDAYFSHDSFLFGMLQQDPTLQVLDLLPPELTVTHYGIATAKGRVELVQFVNAVLAELFVDGTWSRLVTTWLVEPLSFPPQDPPRWPATFREVPA